MCSTPKGSTTKPLLSAHVDSLSSDMSSAAYSDLVSRANESYEQRQKELIEYRKKHNYQNKLPIQKPIHVSYLEKLKALLNRLLPLNSY